jgi:DNA-binding CsgD family transcriptional regulator
MPSVVVVTKHSSRDEFVDHLVKTSVRALGYVSQYELKIVAPSVKLSGWSMCFLMMNGFRAWELQTYLEELRRSWPAGATLFLVGDSERLSEVVTAVASLELPRVQYLIQEDVQSGVRHQLTTRSRKARRNDFTERELEILRLVAEGNTNGMIGEFLGITELTVKSHMQRIGSKMGMRCRAGMIAIACRSGLI